MRLRSREESRPDTAKRGRLGELESVLAMCSKQRSSHVCQAASRTSRSTVTLVFFHSVLLFIISFCSFTLCHISTIFLSMIDNKHSQRCVSHRQHSLFLGTLIPGYLRFNTDAGIPGICNLIFKMLRQRRDCKVPQMGRKLSFSLHISSSFYLQYCGREFKGVWSSKCPFVSLK